MIKSELIVFMELILLICLLYLLIELNNIETQLDLIKQNIIMIDFK